MSQPPVFVMLEMGEDARVAMKSRGVRRVRIVTASAGIVAETKWIKRFRKTIINRKLRSNCVAVWDRLVNEGEGK